MALNRRVHLAPQRPVEVVMRESREGPPHSKHPFEHCYVDLRYLDAKPGGIQLYSCLLLEGYSRTILAGSLTRRQDVGVVLRIYYLALLQFGCWAEVISDHGGQFQSHAFARINRRLQIKHEMYEKGHPWENLIEAQFGIQARVGEYAWERCQSVDEAVEVHRELIRDHNRLPHFAHRKRNDQRHAPLEVLGPAQGRETDAATLHRAFSRMAWQRTTDERGFVRINRWKIYVEEGLPRTSVQVTYWDGHLRAEYQSHLLTEYRCRWNGQANRPKAISHPQYHEHPFSPRQAALFDPLWVRTPVESESPRALRPQKVAAAGGQQMRLYLGPELVKR
jgi:transposase InsO family protein